MICFSIYLMLIALDLFIDRTMPLGHRISRSLRIKKIPLWGYEKRGQRELSPYIYRGCFLTTSLINGVPQVLDERLYPPLRRATVQTIS